MGEPAFALSDERVSRQAVVQRLPVGLFLDEEDRSGLQPTYTAIVEFLRKRGVAGASAFRGIEGFGQHQEMHVATIFSWLPNLPILIEVVDEWSVLEPLMPELGEMLGEGLITIEPVQYLRLTKQK